MSHVLWHLADGLTSLAEQIETTVGSVGKPQEKEDASWLCEDFSITFRSLTDEGGNGLLKQQPRYLEPVMRRLLALERLVELERNEQGRRRPEPEPEPEPDDVLEQSPEPPRPSRRRPKRVSEDYLPD